ncbi:MAG: hypothetical protein COW18_09690 [Zetaproteobacteria bacterium CG12_big_fil_rev_8_21_14_0_65_54_13]|nr:MAG: hypothetical protein COX55_09385 [Zetaproteobacteria bacterium CG23_combo_of_CG06-09_8_20_14_all_54_7]PIW47107.1 MAG: hypothetical protein COW18_09690 [Zetaproteobacteria bacterium CG12_big_fil_rev_8_21_14_0_65_54_13]PIX54108.1 MAG: hypothetical protein COZ50_09810 [Zetaproteobacteria bacterium CG_4_10_14_3_um_filter_54_28]PJA27181.1 MAG: hypothetical protein CO188_12985 [Zetaproteobacteria bacterium CG_4_9_14_3_um_filter_54_145]
MNKQIRTAYQASAFALVCCIPLSAQATPAFSRQINADCRTCHFQSMQSLNKFGREFKLNSFHETAEMKHKRLQQLQASEQRKEP